MTEPNPHNEVATCGECGRSWNPVEIPTPAARCPYEYDHAEPDAVDRGPDPVSMSWTFHPHDMGGAPFTFRWNMSQTVNVFVGDYEVDAWQYMYPPIAAEVLQDCRRWIVEDAAELERWPS